MYIKKSLIKISVIILAAILFVIITAISLPFFQNSSNIPKIPNNPKSSPAPKYKYEEEKKEGYIKWVDFNIPYNVLKDALDCDIYSYNNGIYIDWVQLLAYLGAKYGGNFNLYKKSDIDGIMTKVKNEEDFGIIVSDMKQYRYFYEAYNAVLGGFVGNYSKQAKTNDSDIVWKQFYGLKVFSPIAEGFSYNHYDDFGASRSYGYARKHLGHDIMGNIGTPICAIEGGYVECIGWNQYGGMAYRNTEL